LRHFYFLCMVFSSPRLWLWHCAYSSFIFCTDRRRRPIECGSSVLALPSSDGPFIRRNSPRSLRKVFPFFQNQPGGCCSCPCPTACYLHLPGFSLSFVWMHMLSQFPPCPCHPLLIQFFEVPHHPSCPFGPPRPSLVIGL